MHIVRVMAFAALFVVFGPIPAAGQPGDPSVAVAPDVTDAGALVAVQGTGWIGTCGVELWLDGVDGQLLGVLFVDSSEGTISGQVTIPADAQIGQHEIVAIGLGFAGEFCGDPDGTSATTTITIRQLALDHPTIVLSSLEGTPGSEIEITGAGFCADPECSDIDIWFGGALAASDIPVEEDGSFTASIVLPVVSPLGKTELFAVQTDADGQTQFGYGEFETLVRPATGQRPNDVDDPNDDDVDPEVGPDAIDPNESGGLAFPSGRSGPPMPPPALVLLSLMGLVATAVIVHGPSTPRPIRLLRPRIAGGPLLALGLLAALLAPISAASGTPPPSALTDVNPDGLPGEPRFGGRALGLTVDPTNPMNIYVASELGGIWRSSDGGTNWNHVDEIDAPVTRDVFYDPQDASIIVATGQSNGSTDTNGGVWVSDDGGTTWSQPASALPRCTNQPTFWSGAIPDDAVLHTNVYVGTSCGIAISTDEGVTWNHTDPCTAANAAWCNGSSPYFDVVAQVVGGMVQLDVCGDEGFFRSTDGGATWSAPDAASPARLNPNLNPCHVATAPGDTNTVYLANYSGLNAQNFCISQLLESTAGGAAGTWTTMAVTASNCRDAWVVTHPALDGDANHFEVYFGTSQSVQTQHCDLTQTPRCNTAVASWSNADVGAHPDPSDIAFDPSAPNGCPIVLSTDGGISTSADCGATWVDGNRGYHALDIRALAGVVDGDHTDIYFGTQDNGLYVSFDNAATWDRPAGADVYNVLADPVAPGRVFYRQCFGCGDNIADDHLANLGGFSDPPGTIPTTAVATQFGPQSYAFVTNDGAMNPTWSVWVTTDEGANWSQMGPNLPGNPGEIRAAGPAANPTFYLRLNVGGFLRMYRLTGAFDATATLALANGGLTRPTSAWNVDPADPTTLYVTDNFLNRMMVSTDSGANWNPDLELTGLVTRGGTYPFVQPGLFTQPRAVSFDPNSSQILVGTRTAGLFASATGGASWGEVPGGQTLGLYRDFFFDSSDGSIYAATQGRGLWRIDLPLVDLSITKSDSVDPAVAGEQLTYTVSVDNDGPGIAHDVVVVDALPSEVTYVSDTAPVGCVDDGLNTLTCDVGDIVGGGSTSFQIVVDVAADAVFDAGGPFTMTNRADVSSSVIDTDATNDAAVEDTAVVAVADLEIVSFEAADPPGQIIVGEPEQLTLNKVITNNGPSGPMDVKVSMTGVGSPGVTVVPTDASFVEGALGLGELRQVDESLTLSCEEASNHSFTFTNTIEPNDPLDTDPDLSNNEAEVEIDVLCVVPVAINIKPGSFPNSINLSRATVPLAVLTTEAGEYGLPLAFDATTIDPMSVRFGPADAVFNGLGGASERHNRGHIEDSRELDERTRDGDDDMVLHFRANETGLTGSEIEACVYGTWTDGMGIDHAFFGCDSIRPVPPK